MSKQKLIILDGHALFHRAWHALPQNMKDAQGRLTGAVFGFTASLLKSWRDLKPDYITVCFDSAGPTFRDKIYEHYKAGRIKKPAEFYNQLPLIKQMLMAFNIPVYEQAGLEADDLIGAIARQAVKNKNLEVIIVTGDLDALQLISQQIKVYTFKKGITETVMFDEAAVKKRYQGLGSIQMIDFKALRGDPSDNIPGVPGIGEKTAIELLNKFDTLDGIYRAVELK